MDKRLLKQALKFKDDYPSFSQTKYLNELVKVYQRENEKIFTDIRYRKRSKILDFDEFFNVV